MVKSSEQLRVKALLTEAITVLCKNGLRYRREFSVEGLLGITLDNEDVFLININETVREAGDSEEEEETAQTVIPSPPRVLKQERPKSPVKEVVSDTSVEMKHIPARLSPPRDLPSSPGQRARNRRRSGETSGSPPAKRKTLPRPSQSNSPIDSKDDIIIIKEERLSDDEDNSSQTDILTSSSLQNAGVDPAAFLQQTVFNQSLSDSSFLHDPSDSNASFQDSSGSFAGPGCSSWDPSMMSLSQPVPIEGSLTQNQDMFPCKVCGRVFTKRCVRNRHFRIVHEKRALHTCACGRGFGRLDQFKRHFSRCRGQFDGVDVNQSAAVDTAVIAAAWLNDTSNAYHHE